MDNLAQEPLPIPATLEEAAASERIIDRLLARRRVEVARYTRKKQQLNHELDNQHASRVLPLEKEIFERSHGIEQFASFHRAVLTKGETHKTISLPRNAGEILWGLNPVAIAVVNLKAALESIRRKGFGVRRFIRTREEINKAQLRQHVSIARRIDGVTVEQDEQFEIRPRHSKERVVKNLTRGEWAIIKSPEAQEEPTP